MRVKYEKIPLHSLWLPRTWPGGVRYQGTFTWEGRVRQWLLADTERAAGRVILFAVTEFLGTGSHVPLLLVIDAI
jgi:hypothetical protein